MNLMNKQGNGEYGSRQHQAGERRRLLTSPPPPNFLEARRAVKKAALLCLFLFCIIAAPVQGQTRQVNPTTMGACGLPTAYAGFTDQSTVTTFDLRSDCMISPSQVLNDWPYLRFESGTFTINGNGFSIIGPSNGYAIIVGLPTADTTTVLNLNDITIRNAGRELAYSQAVIVQREATLNGRNVIFRDNVGAGGALHVYRRGKAYLEDVQFLNNKQTHGTTEGLGHAASVLAFPGDAAAGTVLSITDGIFEGNTSVRTDNETVISASGATLQLQGCIIFRNNEGSKYMRRTLAGVLGVIIDNSDNSHCPKRKKEKVPTATATLRPLATTCIDLNQATGIVVHATYGLGSGVQCQRLGGGGIGFQALADSFIDAVDVWGYVEQGVEVCFPAAGELLFLDARTMPRAIIRLASTVVNGMTCGAIDSPGSIVLMPPS